MGRQASPAQRGGDQRAGDLPHPRRGPADPHPHAGQRTEFHAYKTIEQETRATVYFATPHHSWERGTNENTNGLIRQYIPKRTSMAQLTQADCDQIAKQLNDRPRKRLGYRTPAECYDKKKK